MKHASVRIGEYDIPLIGIPPSATEYECDLCHNIFEVEKMEVNAEGNAVYCPKCRSKPASGESLE